MISKTLCTVCHDLYRLAFSSRWLRKRCGISVFVSVTLLLPIFSSHAAARFINGADPAVGIKHIHVKPVANVAPVLAAIEVSSLSYSEGQLPVAVTLLTTVTDIDNANLAGAVIQ